MQCGHLVKTFLNTNNKLSAYKNIQIWKKFTIKLRIKDKSYVNTYGPKSFVWNETIFSKDIPLDKFLKCIYCPKTTSFQHELLITNRLKLKNFLHI